MRDDRFDWLHQKGEAPAPEKEHLAMFWMLRGATGRDLTCSAYRVATGLELRAEYGEQDIAASELFRGMDADEQLTARADAWRLTLIAKGFREIAR